MKHTKLLVLTLGLFTVCALPVRALAYPEVMPSTVQANNQFGYVLTRAVAREEFVRDANRNILISPVSAAVALQMLLNGAGPGSHTYQELAGALGVANMDLAAINRSNQALLTNLTTRPPALLDSEPTPFQLKIANSVWASSSSPFRYLPTFLGTLSRSYDAQANLSDFESADGALPINQWASQETAGKVPSVIDEQTLARLSFVMLNATYFKAAWSHPFNERATLHDQSFTLADGTTARVDMMGDRGFGYTETNTAQVMELPYAGRDVSMYVVLPKDGRSLAAALEDSDGPLSPAFWEQVRSSDKSFAFFSMPKFGFNDEVKLNESLHSMGVASLFTYDADLSSLSASRAKVDLIKQDTFLKVDEKGTEAAAVTVIGGIGLALPSVSYTMKVDRPFLVSIVDKATGSVLFLGAISKP